MTSCPSLSATLALCLVAMGTRDVTAAKTTPDPHGGVKMGVPNKVCDNAQDNIWYDWDPSSTKEHTCTGATRAMGSKGIEEMSDCPDEEDQPIHKCYPGSITYNVSLPTSGPHRPLWPEYGEYRYLPVQRWLHSLEHGGIVFLYHPCAHPADISAMKAVARGCLRRHIISPSLDVPAGYNFALLAWRCKMLLSAADTDRMVDFVTTHARQGREKVASDGQYSVALIKHAQIVSNYRDDNLCPGLSSMTPTLTKVKHDSLMRQHSAKAADSKLARSFYNLVKDRLGGNKT